MFPTLTNANNKLNLLAFYYALSRFSTIEIIGVLTCIYHIYSFSYLIAIVNIMVLKSGKEKETVWMMREW